MKPLLLLLRVACRCTAVYKANKKAKKGEKK
jgi:hypothetical protein